MLGAKGSMMVRPSDEGSRMISLSALQTFRPHVEDHGRHISMVGMLNLEVERSSMGTGASSIRLVESPVINMDPMTKI